MCSDALFLPYPCPIPALSLGLPPKKPSDLGHRPASPVGAPGLGHYQDGKTRGLWCAFVEQSDSLLCVIDSEGLADALKSDRVCVNLLTYQRALEKHILFFVGNTRGPGPGVPYLCEKLSSSSCRSTYSVQQESVAQSLTWSPT